MTLLAIAIGAVTKWWVMSTVSHFNQLVRLTFRWWPYGDMRAVKTRRRGRVGVVKLFS